VKNNVRSIIITLFDVKGIVHKEFVPTSQNVNSGFYCDFCGDCVKTREDVAPDFGENRPGCFTMKISVLTQQFMAKNKMAAILHPPYSLDLAPCDFFLFPKTELKPKGRRFDTIDEIQAESQTALDTLIEKDFQEAFQTWRRWWDRCLHAGGNYFEGDGSR